LSLRLLVPREVLDAAVPSLVLQPLVEATVAAAHPAPVRVEISASREDDRVTLRVRADSGTHERASAGRLPAVAGSSGDAIARAGRRLDLEYPGDHRLEWSSLVCEAVVEIPFSPLALGEPGGGVDPGRMAPRIA
jgi:LytS/YehU family sensor histidine kinase